MELIILDCDGGLIDSEKVAQIKFLQLLADRGIIIDEKTCQKDYTGLTVEAIYKKLGDKFNTTFSLDEINDLENQVEQDLFLHVQPIAGVENLLHVLRKFKLPFCVASNSNPMRIRFSLKAAGLLTHFADEHIFSYTMVPNAKPAPDLFLHAAKTFNQTPENCLVIEDSYTGVCAANAAGMRSIAFFGAQHAQHEWYKTRVLNENPTLACETMQEIVTKIHEFKRKSYATSI